MRAIDSLGVSYALNTLPILTAPAFLLPTPQSEVEQRFQQRQIDELQRQQDQIQDLADKQREEDERLVLAVQQQQQDLVG